jgi:triosephosphate isomerase
MLIVNFKKHKKAAELAKKLKRFSIILAVLPKDVYSISKETKSIVYSQYINTKANAQSVKQSGAKGTLLNHSDYPISNSRIKSYISSARKQKLKTVVCCTTEQRAKQIARTKPNYIAVEPKELIGGKLAVSTAKPELITDVVQAVKKASAGRIPVLCGAGIHAKEDVRRAVELGAKGILVSSAVVKAKRPERVLRELIKGMK